MNNCHDVQMNGWFGHILGSTQQHARISYEVRKPLQFEIFIPVSGFITTVLGVLC